MVTVLLDLLEALGFVGIIFGLALLVVTAGGDR